MRIDLNLASRPFTDLQPVLKRLRLAIAALAVAAVAFGLGFASLHPRAVANRQRLGQLNQTCLRLSAERQSFQQLLHQPDNARLLARSAALNRLFDEKAFSWTLAMEDLETVLPNGVQALTLEPTRSKEGVITLHLRVAGPRDRVIVLVENLEHSRHFLHPRIAGESVETSGGPNDRPQPVSASTRTTFELLADYNAAALADRRPESNLKTAAGLPTPPVAAIEPERPALHPAAITHPGPRPALLRPQQPSAPEANGKPFYPFGHRPLADRMPPHPRAGFPNAEAGGRP